MSGLTDLFGQPISVYTRADAITDGTLVDAGTAAAEAGFRHQVALTRAAWTDLVEWTDAAEHRRGFTGQSESGRLWDVLYMAAHAARRATTDRTVFELYRIPAAGRGVRPRRAQATVHIGPGDHGEPVVTIMLPDED